MSYHGDYAPSSTVVFNFNTASFTDGSPITLAGTPALSVYKNSTTESTAGITLTVDYDSRTGMHHVVIDTSADGTFYAAGNDFSVVITTGTVGGTSVVGRVVGAFSLNNRSALRPTTAGRTLDVSATGEAGLDWANIGSPTTAQNLSGTTISTSQAVASVSGAVGSVTGNVGGNVVGTVASVVGNVGGNVTGSVGSVATGGITRASLAADTGLQPIRSNTAQAGASTSITLDASASATNDFYNFTKILLTGGTGAGQVREILDYVGSTKVATVRAWATNPDNTTTFAILPEYSVWDSTTADHLTSGSTGASLNAAGSAGDPWSTTLPGAYGPGTAGHILGTGVPDLTPGAAGGLFIAGTNAATTVNITGSLSGAVGSVTGNVGGNVTGTVGGVTGTISVTSVAVSGAVTIGSTLTVTGGIASNVTGNITGSLSGSVGSVTGAVGSVAGAVGSVTGNVGGNVVGSVGSVAGSVGSVTGGVGGDVSGKILGGGSGTITGDGVRSASVTGNVGGNVAGSVGSVTGAVGSVTGNVGGNVTGSVGSVVAGVSLGTGAITDTALATSGANRIADTTRRRTQANVEASAYGDSLSISSLYGFIQQAQESDAEVNPGSLTVYQTDGTTILGTRTLETDPAAEPITKVS